MWKIFLILIAASAVPSAHAAEIFCSSLSGNPPPCAIGSITNVASPDEVVTVSGQSSTFVDTIQTQIDINSPSQIDFFPRKIFDIFPNVLTVNVANINLPNLVINTFGACGIASTITGKYLKATNLPASVAQNCAHLEYLEFSFGELQTLDPNALLDLTSLKSLYLNDNKIACIPPGFFAPTQNLVNISFNSNQITMIDSNVLAGLTNLNFVQFNDNMLTFLPFLELNSPNIQLGFQKNLIIALNPDLLPAVFQAKNPRTISFSSSLSYAVTCFTPSNAELHWVLYNQVSTTFGSCYDNWTSAMANAVNPCTVTTTTSTTAITARPEGPGVCPSDGICRFYLDYVDRYTCVLDGVDGTLTSISGTHISPLFTDANVTRVYFTHSFLSRVPPAVFTKFPSVDFLSVANCSLGMFTNSTMPVCGALKYLDARFNEIFHVSTGAFKNCASLQTIDFTGNPIEVLDSLVFTLDPSLKRVILNGDNSNYTYRK